MRADAPARSPRTGPTIDLTAPGAVARGSVEAQIIDTRLFNPQVQVGDNAWGAEAPRAIKGIIPAHEKPPPPPAGPANNLSAGATLDEPRTIPQQQFPTNSSNGWNPPDPTLAVGPNHVVVTVNMTIGFYTKAGVQQFFVPLNNTGNPGFFEPQGAAGFTFDPKCFYDHIAQRFVVVALEAYTGSNEAYVDIAVSDDSDPNGVWYKYRTDAVTNISGVNYWWDYPGLGYDGQAYYVTSNLFAMSSGPYGGCGFRVFNKTPMLTGAPATYSTLREPGGYVIQPARHFGTPAAPFFTYIVNSTTVRIYAITNPLTAPALVSTNVAVPAYTGSTDAPTQGGQTVSVGGSADPVWRDGRLYWCHNASTNGRNTVRWHQFNTGTWPTSGGISRLQSGDVDAGPGLFTMFPAISANSAQDVAVALGASGADNRVSVRIAGRRSTDPLGRMGQPVLLKDGDTNTGGRYGDYYAIAVDPADDTTFWAIGEYPSSSGSWQNWVTSFRISDESLCHPVSDDAGVFQTAVQSPITIDVLANDWHSSNLTMTISAFSAVSTRGGTITRSIGTGPGGRDRLTYTPPLNSAWLDSFTYTAAASGQSAAAAVVAQLYNPATYRAPDPAGDTRAGAHASYFDLVAPTATPDFGLLTPFAADIVPTVNFPSSGGVFATSARSDNIGAVFTGYVNIPTTNLYQFHLNSDDGSKLYLGGVLVLNNDGLHGMVEKSTALLGLRAGTHAVRVEFFEGGGGAGLIASLSGTDLPKAPIPAPMWSFSPPTCAADYDGDLDVGTDADIAAFFACIGGSCCPLCGSADFNGDGDTGTDLDIEAFFRVLGGGNC